MYLSIVTIVYALTGMSRRLDVTWWSVSVQKHKTRCGVAGPDCFVETVFIKILRCLVVLSAMHLSRDNTTTGDNLALAIKLSDHRCRPGTDHASLSKTRETYRIFFPIRG